MQLGYFMKNKKRNEIDMYCLYKYRNRIKTNRHLMHSFKYPSLFIILLFAISIITLWNNNNNNNNNIILQEVSSFYIPISFYHFSKQQQQQKPYYYKYTNTNFLHFDRNLDNSFVSQRQQQQQQHLQHQPQLLRQPIVLSASKKTFFSDTASIQQNKRRTFLFRLLLASITGLQSSMSSTQSSSSNTAIAATISTTDTSSLSSLYWNREYGIINDSSKSTQEEVEDYKKLPIIRDANIICLSKLDDSNNRDLYDITKLPNNCTVVHIGCTNLTQEKIKQLLNNDKCNIIFISDGYNARQPLEHILQQAKIVNQQILWIHSRSAGVDTFINSPVVQEYFSTTSTSDSSTSSSSNSIITNAKGCYSSTLAEYTIMSCLYFAKNLPRLLQQKQNKIWNPFPILELRGSTLGIIGFGDIGQAAGRLAISFGMNIIALTRTAKSSAEQQLILQTFPSTNNSTIQFIDMMTNNDALNNVFKESDYILVSTPLTDDTRGMIGKEQFQIAKHGCVIINVGRGPVINENELIIELQGYISGNSNCNIKGAALDVTTIEPLEQNSLLWTLDNVLVSPHNMDMTESFMYESTSFFINEQLPRFIRNVSLLNPVNYKDGY